MPSLAYSFAHRPLLLLAAIAPHLSLEKLQSALFLTMADQDDTGWVRAEFTPMRPALTYPTFQWQTITLAFISDAYSDCLHQAEIAIARLAQPPNNSLASANLSSPFLAMAPNLP
ncbi:MAG: hypothetical protein HC800_19495 [Phormidesmis sp. RL_2_1]|nr:hypothetical protein [Phormidesmis sp. RL_2_1]